MEERQDKVADVVYNFNYSRQFDEIPGSAFLLGRGNRNVLLMTESVKTDSGFPKESGEFLVVQLDIDSEHYLLFFDTMKSKGFMDDNYILAEFLKTKEVLDYRGIDFQNERYSFVAVGYSQIDSERKQATFCVTDGRYNIGSDASRAHLRSIEDKVEDWNLTFLEEENEGRC